MTCIVLKKEVNIWFGWVIIIAHIESDRFSYTASDRWVAHGGVGDKWGRSDWKGKRLATVKKPVLFMDNLRDLNVAHRQCEMRLIAAGLDQWSATRHERGATLSPRNLTRRFHTLISANNISVRYCHRFIEHNRFFQGFYISTLSFSFAKKTEDADK